MKIEKIEFQNIGLLSGQYEIKGNSVIVIAENGSGKTTFCESFARVCNNAMPKDIVSKGAVSGSCTFTLSDGSVLDWSKANDKKPVITLTSTSGKVSKPTQKALKELVGSDFDVNRDFINVSPKERKAFIASVSGLDFAELDQSVKVAEENRTYIKRSCKEAEARAAGANPSLAEKKPYDISAINEQIAELAAKDAKQQEQSKALTRLNDRKAAIDSEMKQLEERFKALKKEKGKLLQDIERGQNAVLSHESIQEDIARLKQDAEDANAENEKIRAAKAKQVDVQAFIQKQEEVQEAESAVTEARNEKIKAVSSAKFPAGLQAGEDGETLLFQDKNGKMINLESANEAQKTIIGLMIGLEQIGEVKAMAVDVSHLDKKNRQLVFDWAAKSGLQLFAEKVSDDEELVIEIVNRVNQ